MGYVQLVVLLIILFWLIRIQIKLNKFYINHCYLHGFYFTKVQDGPVPCMRCNKMSRSS